MAETEGLSKALHMRIYLLASAETAATFPGVHKRKEQVTKHG
jgi:hypothetical protein